MAMSLSLTVSPIPPPHKALADKKPATHVKTSFAVTPPVTPQPQAPQQPETPVAEPTVEQPVQVEPPAPSYPTDHTAIMAAAGISPSDYGYVDYIVSHESGWNVYATNASSGAYGLCQALPGSKMANAGADWDTNPVTQMIWCNLYAQTAHGGGWYNNYVFWANNHWW